jgi:hypothetical protein
MGLLANDVRVLVGLSSRGTTFSAVVTLGCQWLMCPRAESGRILLGARVSMHRITTARRAVVIPLFARSPLQSDFATDALFPRLMAAVRTLRNPLRRVLWDECWRRGRPGMRGRTCST